MDVLGLVDGDGEQFHARLFLPVFVHLVDGFQLAVARVAPCGKEVDDERLAAVVERVSTHGLAIDVFECDTGKLSHCRGSNA